MKNTYPATSPVIGIPGVNNALQYSTDAGSLWNSTMNQFGGGTGGSNVGFDFSDTYGSNTGQDGLFGNIGNYMNSDFMGGFSDLASGLGGLAGVYFGYQQMQDAKKNNSLYRSVMGEQQNQRSDFINNTNQAFGNTGRTDFKTNRPV